MSFYDLPPSCAAHSCATNALPGPGWCTREPTLRLIAYDLGSQVLWACHTEPVCDEHAEALAAHWRHAGVRTRHNSRPRKVTCATAPFVPRSVGGVNYPGRLAEPLPGMPGDPPPAEPARRPAAHLAAPVTLDDADCPSPESRLDVFPSDQGRWGKDRREMVAALARAHDCHPAAMLSAKGPWPDRLDLSVFGPVPQIDTLARTVSSRVVGSHSDMLIMSQCLGSGIESHLVR